MGRTRRKNGKRSTAVCFWKCLEEQTFPHVLQWVNKKEKEFLVLFKHKKSPHWNSSDLDFFKKLECALPSKINKYKNDVDHDLRCKMRCRANLRKLCKDGILKFVKIEKGIDNSTQKFYKFLEIPRLDDNGGDGLQIVSASVTNEVNQTEITNFRQTSREKNLGINTSYSSTAQKRAITVCDGQRSFEKTYASLTNEVYKTEEEYCMHISANASVTNAIDEREETSNLLPENEISLDIGKFLESCILETDEESYNFPMLMSAQLLSDGSTPSFNGDWSIDKVADSL